MAGADDDALRLCSRHVRYCQLRLLALIIGHHLKGFMAGADDDALWLCFRYVRYCQLRE